MKRYFIHLCYKGTNYCGWQTQPEKPTVQETIEKSLLTLLKTNIPVTGCGRTDTGVHARNFYAHFDLESFETDLPKNIVYKLNCILPLDIKIFDIYPVQPDAHARFDATCRHYKYYISLEKDIFQSDYVWQLFKKLDIETMNKAAGILKNYADFTSFSKLHSGAKTNICKIKSAKWNYENGLLVFSISADRFLRNMVRAIVGTLIDIGKEKITIDEFQKIIENKNRSEAGISVPASGLFLENVEYAFPLG
jgi:tRNA pseudouridine38-40 synthase